MLLTLRLIYESLIFAIGALRENLLRTILSLLGVTVGIFAIISVLALVDTLEKSIKTSFSFLGSDVIYVAKWPWLFVDDYPWWKYVNRPNPSYEEYKALEKRMTLSTAISISAVRGNLTAKYKSNSVGGMSVIGVSFYHDKVSDVRIEEGRYFSIQEVEGGSNVAIIGAVLAADLFGSENPIGKTIKVKEKVLRIIAVMKKQGASLLDTPSADNLCLVPFNFFMRNLANKRRVNPTIAVKGSPETDIGLLELENELRGAMRGTRGIKPKQEDSFALNRPEMLSNFIDGLISVLKKAGWFISAFSLLVGGFGIANIMFVSVKERTNLIGIQKSLGAKNFFILFQFLFEAMFLSAIGGVSGILCASLLTFLSIEGFEIVLKTSHIIQGLVISSIIGILAGIIPAYVASRLDPVIAIRSK
jgi:putative ABC transport system permease protein